MFDRKRLLNIVILMTICLSLIAASAAHARKEKFRPQSDPEMDTIAGTVIQMQVKVDRMYLLVDTGESDKWAAIEIPKNLTIKVGDVVTVEGVVMRNFHVKGMKRDFGTILFGSLVENESSSGWSREGTREGTWEGTREGTREGTWERNRR
jgi:hypothetical protein